MKMGEIIGRTIDQVASVDPYVIAFALTLVSSIIVLDRFRIAARAKRAETGLSPGGITVSVDGSKSVPVREYISPLQGLAGRPDALILERGHIIPIERKPLARKLRDRYVAQLLVYMRLVEEFEGKRPPYGYLILGPNARQIRIDNTPERQAWLQGILDEMRAIAKGAPSIPTPDPRKCSKCDVRDACSFRADLQVGANATTLRIMHDE